MSGLSRGWCFLARFVSWEHPLRDELMRRMGFEPRRMLEHLADDHASLIRAVRDAGYAPQVRIVPYRWADLRSPEEMAGYLCRRYFTEAERERLYAPALGAARELADEKGLLRDAVSTEVAWIWWNAQA